MKTRKKLIEVALPLDKINEACAREKSIRHGHPSTLHLWWARRPLAAARAVIFAQMVDDPSEYVDVLRSDPKLKRKGESELKKRRADWEQRRRDYERAAGSGLDVPEPGPKPELDDVLADLERQRLFRLIEELVLWENTTNEAVLQRARDEIWQSWRRTCADNVDHPQAGQLFDRSKLPAFHDPFAGGGALPLEAQRLGLESFASDLNPVAVTINKAMIEIPPKFAGEPPVNPEARKGGDLRTRNWPGALGLAEDVRYYGRWMRDQAEDRLARYYPGVEVSEELAQEQPKFKKYLGRDLTVIAWIWARTVRSPDPAFGSVWVPLVSNFMLSTKKGKPAYVEPVVQESDYSFRVHMRSPPDLKLAKKGTKAGRGTFKCLMSGAPITGDYIKAEALAGRMKCRLMAIAALGDKERLFLPPSPKHVQAADSAEAHWKPEIPFFQDALGFRVGAYGMSQWSDLFTDRQAATLATVVDLVAEASEKAKQDALSSLCDSSGKQRDPNWADSYSRSLQVLLSLTASKMTRFSTTLTTWRPDEAKLSRSFSRHDIPITWDFAETNPFSGTGGDIEGLANGTASVIENSPGRPRGSASQQNAAALSVESPRVFATDPPYYDNIGYADLSDYFYVWLRRAARTAIPELFATVAVPKDEELVATPARHGGRTKAESFFLDGMRKALQKVASFSMPGYPASVFYAFKQAEKGAEGDYSTGWETFLAAAIEAGFSITGTWPIRTEGKTRMRGMASNALATRSVIPK